MVQAIVNINDYANRVLNILKAKFDLRDKSEAINLMAEKYGEELLEPELRPEYVKKLKNILKRGKFTSYKTLSAFKKDIKNA